MTNISTHKLSKENVPAKIGMPDSVPATDCRIDLKELCLGIVAKADKDHYFILSTWGMWFSYVAITLPACAWPANLALRIQSGVYFWHWLVKLTLHGN